MIQLEQVSYSYQQTAVLKNLNLHETEPVISGLWGRNGAGKTTLMSLIAGHNRPASGTIRVMGQNPYNNLKVQDQLCYIQEAHSLGKSWTVRDLVRFGQYFHSSWDQDLAERLIEMFELPTKKKIATFSKGMNSAAQMILGLASKADVTILDEPTNGLDAEKRKYFYRALLDSYEDHPRLILVSSHHIEEIQPLCESLIVLHDGEILIHQQMEEIREQGILLTGSIQDVNEVVQHAKVLESSELGSTLKVMIDAPYSAEWKELARDHRLSIEKATLQDYLINITRKSERVRG
ncbi:multidrug ABC transporter ATP-binding protein [Paenibacillus sp. Root52]|uniref:ATP-binding cassette domain-containing protein n=1 Tax=Paenibacillus sp. Root52 TaxID=1736552 RepID=UPI0006F813F6|nr:ABC transporter ATP-binding protein [Paenibacillus sp. Root52]KQY79917.1 multidrug ABC transporter ATP-binding protein [Paenibacillus sp. Root52]